MGFDSFVGALIYVTDLIEQKMGNCLSIGEVIAYGNKFAAEFESLGWMTKKDY